MDLNQTNSNTRIMRGNVGFNLSTNKPTVSGTSDVYIPTTGFYNDPPNFVELLERPLMIAQKTITSEIIHEYEVTPANLILSSVSLKDLFMSSVVAKALKFTLVVHTPSNVNGKLGIWFDPSTADLKAYIKAHMDASTTSNAPMLEPLSLKALFMNLDQASEMCYTVTLPYPVNIPASNFLFGTLKYGTVLPVYFGTGVNSFDVTLYMNLLVPSVAPLGRI